MCLQKMLDTTISGTLLKSYVQFDVHVGEVLYARVGISAVSIRGCPKKFTGRTTRF